jgi:poly(3-hydroxybutyrate) depolymerase
MVPLSEGTFGLGNCIDYIISILHHLGGNTHVIGMSISSVPVLAAIAAMEAQNDPNVPHSMILMGGPVGTKSGLPKELSELQALITEVPEFYRGSKRKVISANSIAKNRKGMLVDSAKEGFQDLSDQFRTTSIDVAAELYVQLAEAVFKHTLAKGQMMHHGVAINPSRIRRVALMTIEGDKDNFTQRGQTEAAHHLCANIPRERKAHWLQPNVDHLGIFGGDRFRAEIAPRISDFVLTAQLSNRTRRPAQSVTGRKEATSSKEPKHEKADFSSS